MPNFSAASYNLGNLLYDTGSLDDAEAAYRAALAARPDYAEACNALGTVLQRRGRLADAAEAFRAAAQYAPALGRTADQSRRRLARPGTLRRRTAGVAGGARHRSVACLRPWQSGRASICAPAVPSPRSKRRCEAIRAGADRASLDHQSRCRLADAGAPRGNRGLSSPRPDACGPTTPRATATCCSR